MSTEDGVLSDRDAARPAAVAHELNNLLTAIRGYTQLARESLPEGDPVRDDLDRVLDAAHRAAGLTRRLLDAQPPDEGPDAAA